jgi:hypothetical protein
MEFIAANYDKKYQPNTRETVRRQTMHQFVEAGLALYNPDDPSRPINSPHAVYQVDPKALELLRLFGQPDWQVNLAAYIKQKSASHRRQNPARDLHRVPVRVAEGVTVSFSPGQHSALIKAVVEEFAPRFTPGAKLLHAGDTEKKDAYSDAAGLRMLAIALDPAGKMPDVILHDERRDWLILVEAVTSHGPIDAHRHIRLRELFAASTAGLVYVTAFPGRSAMAKYLPVISWQTEVWCADAPNHLIHFNGDRFLGPYTNHEG